MIIRGGRKKKEETSVCTHNAAVDTLDWTCIKLGYFQPEVNKQTGGHHRLQNNREGIESAVSLSKKDNYAVYIYMFVYIYMKKADCLQNIKLKLSQAWKRASLVPCSLIQE